MPQTLNASQPDLYSDAAENTAAPPAEEPTEQEQAPEEQTEDSGGSTALLPTNFFGGEVKPGDTCTVTVVRVHDDQVEVKYDKSAEADEYGSESPQAPPPAEGEMSSMME